MLRVKGLHKEMPGFVIRGEFAIAPGDRVVLTGPSGSGKSTLLRWMSGLLPTGPSDGGEIWLGDKNWTALMPEKRSVGFVFQDQALFSTMNVYENAVFGLKMRGVPKSEHQAFVLPWLEKVGLLSKIKSPIDVLSGGERQRLAFIRALVWKPQVLLLDEPFSALDAGLRAALRQELLELHRMYPVPLLLVSHDEEDARAIATRRFQIVCDAGGRERRITEE